MVILKAAAVLAVLALAACAADAARILAVMPMPARSHHIAFSAALKALADRGHDVTYFSGLPKGNKINPANTKVFHLELPFENMATTVLKDFWEQKQSPFEQLQWLMKFGVDMVNSTLNNPVFKAEVNKPGQKYDVVLAEIWFFQEAMVGLGHKFKCPVVGFNPFGSSAWINEAMGNPVNPSYVPSPFLGLSDRMSFTERAMNAILHVVSSVSYYYFYMPNMQAVVDLHFPDAPPLQDMLTSTLGLTLINNHFTLGYPAPMSPNVVEIGGIHIPDKPNALPKDLQDFMDSAKEGVVYFSMGSNLKVEHMPEEKREAILAALGSIKQRVLLKWDGPLPKNLAPNMKHIEWAPQGDLLAHPNMRAFFTHGGLLSTQESVHHGVPLIGMPMFGDQQFNMLLAVNKGFCVKVNFKELTKESLEESLKEIVKPKYKEAAMRLSRLFRTKPLTPRQSTVFAIESLLQNGADHLRPSSVGMPLYQLLLLDVVAAALLPFLLLFLCCRKLCCSKKADQTPSAAARKKKNN